MKPEDQARQDIDGQLLACGWIVQDRQSMNIHAGPGVAVREFPVVKPDGKRGSVDYLLYADAKAIGVVEAKPADHPTTPTVWTRTCRNTGCHSPSTTSQPA